MAKVRAILEDISQESVPLLGKYQGLLPPGTLMKNAKISKGEHYLSLPYMILDYPRMFSPNSTYAIRHMFWWGHFFSSTLHLEGEALESSKHTILKKLPLYQGQGFYICIHKDPWSYHYQKNNYTPVNDCTDDYLANLIVGRNFLKISRFIPIHDWEKFHDHAVESIDLFLELSTQ